MPLPTTDRTLQVGTPTAALLSWGAVAAMVGAVTALIGTYWDDAWHTDIGRDTFWSPPHLVLYAGVALFATGVALWAFLRYLQVRNLRELLRDRALVLALLGAGVTMASAPLDDFWHHAFGRDAVLWSPPHMAGVTGIFTLAAGALLWVSRISGRTGRRLTIFGTAAVLAALLAVVFEYESDVPQFSVFWYLPILTAAAALAFSLGHRRSRDRWIATKAALVYTGLMLGVVGFLAALGHSNTLIPFITLPALVFDLGARHRLSRPSHAAAFAAAVFAAYVPYLNYVLGGVRFAVQDVLLGLPLAFLATLGILALTSATSTRPIRSRFLAPVVALASLGFDASPGYAHDPGQGAEVAVARLTAGVVDGEALLVGALLGSEACESFEGAGLVARRAGRTLRAPLARTGGCSFEGRIGLPDRGRWFVYLELSHAGERVEAWIPVIVSARPSVSERVTSVYRPPQGSRRSLQVAAGIGLYALNLMLMLSVIAMFRNQAGVDVPGAAAERDVRSFREVSQ